MKQIIKKIIKVLFIPIKYFFVLIFHFFSIFDNRKLCIIFMDGGLGSQINKLALGLNLKKNGYLVKYDLSAFRKQQKDINGIFNRNFDLDKVYDEKINGASRFEIFYAKCINIYTNKNLFEYNEKLFEQKTPFYLNGYCDNILYWNNVKEELLEHCTFIKKMTPNIQQLINEISENENSVVIHVRRGDYVGSNFDVTTPKYFINAITKLVNELKNPKFYFFSNEPNWVLKDFIPLLTINIDYQIVTLNGNDNGFDDIGLMNYAKHFILSNSSFSIMGAFFAKEEVKTIIMPELWFRKRNPTLFDEKLTDSEYKKITQNAHDITGNTIFLPCFD